MPRIVLLIGYNSLALVDRHRADVLAMLMDYTTPVRKIAPTGIGAGAGRTRGAAARPGDGGAPRNKLLSSVESTNHIGRSPSQGAGRNLYQCMP